MAKTLKVWMLDQIKNQSERYPDQAIERVVDYLLFIQKGLKVINAEPKQNKAANIFIILLTI